MAGLTERLKRLQKEQNARRTPSRSKQRSPAKTELGKELVGEIQQFLVDRGLNVGRRGVDKDFGPGTNSALIEYAMGRGQMTSDKDRQIAQVFHRMYESGQLSDNWKATVSHLPEVYKYIEYGGEAPKTTFKSKGPAPIRDITITYKGSDYVFPLRLAGRSVGDLDKNLKDFILAPIYVKEKGGAPKDYRGYEASDMFQLITTVKPQVYSKLMEYAEERNSQQLAYAASYINRLFTALAQQYSAQQAPQKQRPKAIDHIRRDFAFWLTRARTPAIKHQMEQRALALMERGGAVDSQGNVKSKQLYDYMKSAVLRELEIWLEQYPGGSPDMTVQPQPAQPRPAQPASSDKVQKIFEGIPTGQQLTDRYQSQVKPYIRP